MLIRTRTGRNVSFTERPLHESVRITISKKAESKIVNRVLTAHHKASSKSKVVS
jgi:hypothetical protein